MVYQRLYHVHKRPQRHVPQMAHPQATSRDNFRHYHDDVIKWNHFPRYWQFMRGIHRSPVNSPHKGQWRGALIYAWINGWVNNREAGDLRQHRVNYDVTVMMNDLIVYNSLSTLTTILNAFTGLINASKVKCCAQGIDRAIHNLTPTLFSDLVDFCMFTHGDTLSCPLHAEKIHTNKKVSTRCKQSSRE